MSKKAKSSIYHSENYIQMQKLNCVLKIRFNNDELTPRAEKIKTLRALEFTLRPGYSLFTHREGKGINVLKILKNSSTS